MSPHEPAEEPRWVLFICTGNYYRSRFAEAVFNDRARRQGLSWAAFSRGLAIELIEGDLSPHALAGLQARNIPLDRTAPTRVALTSADLARASRRIALKEAEHRPIIRQRFPDWEHRIEYWHVNDIDLGLPAGAMAAIEYRVDTLVDDLRRADAACDRERAS